MISNYSHIGTLLLCLWHTFYFIYTIIVCCMYLYQSTWADLTWLDLTWLDLTCRSSSYATIVCCISILIYCTLHYHSVWCCTKISDFILYHYMHVYILSYFILHYIILPLISCYALLHLILYYISLQYCSVWYFIKVIDLIW